MRSFVLSCSIVIAVSLVSSSVNADFFVDDFDAGASALWGNETGAWVDAGGVYSASIPENFPNASSSLPFELTDFSVELDVNNIDDGGVWLRSSEASGTTVGRTGVLLVTGVNGGLYWHVVETGASYGSSLNAVSGLFVQGVSDPTLRIEVSGDNYSVFVDGSSLAATSLTTNSFSSGRFAVYDNSNTQSFDNVTLSIPEPTAGMVLFLSAVGMAVFRQRRPV